MGFAVATRLKCTTCGAELLVVEVGDGAVECCDKPLVAVAGEQATPASAKDEHGD